MDTMNSTRYNKNVIKSMKGTEREYKNKNRICGEPRERLERLSKNEIVNVDPPIKTNS